MLDPLSVLVAWLLDLSYRLTPSYGLAIMLLTVAVYIVALPLTMRSTASTAAMAKLQPELAKIRARHPNDRQRLNEETLALMRAHGASPLGGCLPMLLQMPLFIVMYRVIRGVTERAPDGAFAPRFLTKTSALRHALAASGGHMTSFGIDLASTARGALGHGAVAASPFLLLIAAVVVSAVVGQRQVARRVPPRPPTAGARHASTLVAQLGPLMYGVVGFTLPAGVVLYILVSNIARVGQQAIIYRLLRL